MKQLPEIKYPTFNVTIPSTGHKRKFRPFIAKEEKILLIAQQSNNTGDMYDAIKQVINNCSVDDLDIDDLTTFDFDYVFVKIRSNSVSNVVKIKYIDPEDQKEYDFEINLNEVEVNIEGERNPVINITDTMKVKLRYPTMKSVDAVLEEVEQLKEIDRTPTSEDITDKMIARSIESIIDREDIYPANEVTEKELFEFVEKLPHEPYNSIKTFYSSIPQLKHVIKYTNSMGTEQSVELNGLRDFFMW